MTNPNVPANQADAAKNSAPDAKVMPSQPVQMNQNAPAATPTAAPAATASQATAVPVDSAQRQKDADAAKNLKADRAEEQKDVQKSAQTEKSANQNDDYFQKVADDDKIAQKADPFREQARLERQREEDMAKGDPTRDPAAKQAAMDMNTPAPGAMAEAEAMNKGNEKQ